MSHTVVLPALGESVTEGTVTRWLVEVGDTIEVDAPLVEVSTDKVDTEVPSPVAGVVEQILVPEDEDVEVGAALAIIGDGSGAAAPAAPAAAPKAAAAGERSVDAPMPGKIVEVKVSVGQPVKAGDTLLILEAMKMQNEIAADADGTVKAINVTAGQSVKVRDSLVILG